MPAKPSPTPTPLLWKLLQSLGLGVVLIFHSLFPLMGPSRMVYYHSSSPARSVVLACLLDMLFAGAAFFCLRLLAERLHFWRGTQFCIAAIMPWMLLVLDPSLLYSAWAHLMSHLSEQSRHPGNYVDTTLALGTRYLIFLAWVVLLVGLARMLPRVYGTLMTTGGVVLMGMGIFAAFALNTLLHTLHWRPLTGHAAPMHIHADADAHPRIIWLVLDELSYDQTFQHRPADLQLPSFDALAAQGTVYSDARPIGYWTEMVLPSLLLGRQIESVRANPDTRLLIGNGNGKSLLFPSEETITAEAQRAGWNVGIDGWYNPYCNILSGTWQNCSFTDMEDPSGPMLLAASVRQNMLMGAVDQLREVEQDLRFGIAKVEDTALLAHAGQLIADPQMDFIFVHIPVPHPPGSWDRRTGKWARDEPGVITSYEDNLALADRIVGTLLSEAKASPRWSNTTIIVNGDHSWRTAMWRTREFWTAEDERNSHGGQFDDRPALIVHAAGQTAPVVCSAPTSLLQAYQIAHQVIAESSNPAASNPTAR